jgi:undecaprenyl-diphosphatase
MATFTSPEVRRLAQVPAHVSAAVRSASAVKNVAAWLDSRDHRVMVRLNHWRPPRWMRLWMIAATRCGDGWLWYAMGLIVALFGGAERVAALAAAGLAVGLGIAVFLKLKRTIGRRRPCALEPHCWATLLPPDQFSFPSGHTITAFAVALALGSFYPTMLPGLLFCAASVAASRILLGMHFLTDVIAGAALGAALGELCASLLRHLPL